MLKAASVGLGWWSDELAESVQGKSQAIRIVTCTSRSADKRRAFAAKFGTDQHEDYEAVLEDPDIEAVLLTTPNSLHGAHVRQAAAAGKHVFVEKPYTLAAADARSATAACRDSGVVLAVGHNRRFAPATESLKAMIEAGEFGTLLHIEAEFAKDTALGLPPGHWRANRAESPAGAMTGLGIHMVDAICFLFGPIARVTAISKQRAVCVPMDDTTCALFEFESGATGYLGTLFASPLTSFLNVYGSKTAAYAGDDFTTLSVRTADAGPAPKPLAAIDTVRAELEEFAATCAGGDAFRVRPEEATHNVAVMEAIVASAAEGSRSVTVA